VRGNKRQILARVAAIDHKLNPGKPLDRFDGIRAHNLEAILVADRGQDRDGAGIADLFQGLDDGTTDHPEIILF
jgi:hypothetical protein